MHQRLAALFALAAFGVLILVNLNSRAPASGSPEARVSFQIATGASGGSFFTIGQAIAGLISHPPGVGRCEISTVCGPSGVILSARTSQGSFDSLTAVNNGLVDSALVQADMTEAAVKGDGPFRRAGPLRNVRVIAALFPAPVQLLVREGARIDRIGDLAGKRVALGAVSSDTYGTARAILAAFGVRYGSLRRVTSSDPAADLAAGKLDAFFVIAPAPSPLVTAALAGGKARLLAIEGEATRRLLIGNHQLVAATIPAGTYPGVPETVTVADRILWVVRARAPDAQIYGLTRALFNPANHAALVASHPAASAIALATAIQALPAALHPGAARYYREVGKL
jgi:TRAP transporter TAXI family solute receptor